MSKKKKKINSSEYFVYFILLKEKKGFRPTDLGVSIANNVMTNPKNYILSQISINRSTKAITVKTSKNSRSFNSIYVTHEVLLPIIESMGLNIDALIFNSDIFIKSFLDKEKLTMPRKYVPNLNLPRECKESALDTWIDQNQKKLLKNMTKSEKQLYGRMKKTFKSRVSQQHPFVIGDNVYYADICLKSMKVIVEVDGGYHSTPEQQLKDRNRDIDFASIGYRTIRCTNEQAQNPEFASSLIQELLQRKK